MAKKATKKQLKEIRTTIAGLKRMLNSDTHPKLKKEGDTTMLGEVALGEYDGLYEVPVSDEDRETWRNALEHAEAEERRVLAELGVA